MIQLIENQIENFVQESRNKKESDLIITGNRTILGKIR